MATKADILARLQREILSLQGFTPPILYPVDDAGLGQINQSFPNGIFPRSALHEFYCTGAEDTTASAGFISGLLSSLLHKGGVVIWIGASQTIFPPALLSFGIRPENVFFLHLKKEMDVLWAMEEALKCGAVAAVVAELRDLSFTASRRLQLVLEKAGGCCFLLRRNPKNLTTAAVTRWQIKPMQSKTDDALPGVGYPCWQVHLLKVRNGRTGQWSLEWRKGQFRHLPKMAVLHREPQKKTG
jgi:protein ImuA